MKQTTMIAIVLGILLVISAVQAIQLTKIKSSFEGNSLTTGSSSIRPSVASSPGKKTASLPSSVKDLPQMVGGC